MKILSWNVNGIRSVFRTTFREWFAKNDADIVCLQETKADWRELREEHTMLDGYWAYFNSSNLKKGHSGVAVYSRQKPLSVETKLGIPRFDDEGRCLKLTFEEFVLFNFYIPNGSRDQHEIPYKLGVYKKLSEILGPLANGNAILTGDFNVAHDARDVFNAKSNENHTMFTPAEREGLEGLLKLGYLDSFREKYPDKQAYTWWPYRAELRHRDIGWRIDYFLVSKPLWAKMDDAFIQKEAMGSDHCPVGITLGMEVEESEKPVHKRAAKQIEMF